MGIKIAIDGPSGAGKSTLAKSAARELGYMYVDTGAIYRTIGLYIYSNKIDVDDEQSVLACLDNIKITIKYIDGFQHMFLDDADVSNEIRMHVISDYASKIATYSGVREFLLDLQRELAKKNDVIMDGRDIGTVVLPDADLKIYLTASVEERASRRAKELVDKGQNVNFHQILEDIKQRDKRDMERESAPLKKADDAIVLDTTGNDIYHSIELIIKTIKEHIK